LDFLVLLAGPSEAVKEILDSKIQPLGNLKCYILPERYRLDDEELAFFLNQM
jgi:hypothetical protein